MGHTKSRASESSSLASDVRFRQARPRLLVALLAAMLLSPACATRVETPVMWPEELRIRGSVLVLGEDVQAEVVRLRFLELAGGEGADVVEVDLDGSVSLEQLVLLEEASGVWLESARAQQSDGVVDARLLFALAEVVARGGVIAGSGAVGAQLAAATVIDGRTPVMEGLGVIPGVVLYPAFRPGLDRSRFLSVLESEPRLFGIGVPRDAALELRGRRLRAVAGEVILMVPGGMERPVREERLRAGAEGRANQADLTAWRLDAIERTLPPFPGADPAPPNVPRGTLIIVGGGTVPTEVNEAFVSAAGGRDAQLVFVPPEEADSLAEEPGMVRGWRLAGVAASSWIHTKDRGRADRDPAILDPLREATGIWFGGGRQWNFADSYYGTETHHLMREVLARGGVIGGSSAGASIQAEYMARGDPLGNQNIIAPGYERGLGFITGVAIDQHFTQRNRAANMDELMAAYPQLLGIGIDESTAIIVRGTVAEVVGNGRVFFYDRRTDADAEPVVLSAGASYDLAERRVVRPSPEEKPAG